MKSQQRGTGWTLNQKPLTGRGLLPAGEVLALAGRERLYGAGVSGGDPSSPLLPQPPGTCVPGSGQLLSWQDFLQAPLDSLFFRELRYLLLTVLGPDSRASPALGFSPGPSGEGDLHPAWWAPGAAPGALQRDTPEGACL